MTSRQKSSCREEYSISSTEKMAWRIASLFSTRPEVRVASSRASVLFPVPGRPAMRIIIGAEIVADRNWSKLTRRGSRRQPACPDSAYQDAAFQDVQPEQYPASRAT